MQFIQKLKRLPWLWLQAGVYVIYLITHLVGLTAMPVFADEAIYVRWAQLILDDWQRYLFFPLNDGKTPIFVWVMVPFLKVIQDQLLAGRLLGVLVGLGQIWITRQLIALYGGRRKAQLIGMVFSSCLPFWFFYHRVALMDGLMTLFLSLTLWILTKLAMHLERRKSLPHTVLFTVAAGINFGLAILTKIPALFFAPIFVFLAIFPFSTKKRHLHFSKFIWIWLAGLIGCLLFLALKLHPAFGQLFLRGEDFTFTIKDLLGGDWINSLKNIPRFTHWLLFYLTPIVFITPFIGLVDQKLRNRIFFLIVSAMLFCGPFVVFGKTVYPRYLLPTAMFFTVAASLVFETWLEKKTLIQYVSTGLLGVIGLWSLYNMIVSWVNVDRVPYVAIDREQYQTEWSAGYGVKEATQFIQEQAKKGRVVVATEGYFGTLPDGILLYLHNQDVRNIEVFGIGQPIRSIPPEFVAKAKQSQSAYIMVNSHRMKTDDRRLTKVMSYPRPFGAPSFDIYEFNDQQ